MAQIGNVPEINSVKETLNDLKKRGIVNGWELPYESILTRLSAAIFFVDAPSEDGFEDAVKELERYGPMSIRKNEEKALSELDWVVEFKK